MGQADLRRKHAAGARNRRHGATCSYMSNWQRCSSAQQVATPLSGEGEVHLHAYCPHLVLGFRLRALGTDLRLCFAILSMTADCRKKRHVDCSMASLEGEQLLRMDSMSCVKKCTVAVQCERDGPFPVGAGYSLEFDAGAAVYPVLPHGWLVETASCGVFPTYLPYLMVLCLQPWLTSSGSSPQRPAPCSVAAARAHAQSDSELHRLDEEEQQASNSRSWHGDAWRRDKTKQFVSLTLGANME